MAGPWEKYAQAQPSGGDAPADGPWSKYQSAQPAQASGSTDGIVKSAIDSLPMVGGVAGGILGTPFDAVSGPAGNIVGAGIGGYLGTAAKNLINSYYDPKSAPQTATGAVVDAAKGGVEQALMQGTGEAVAPYIGKGVQAAGNATKWAGTKLLSSLGGVSPDVIKEYSQFSNRINAAPSVDALKDISDQFVGKLSSDVEAKKLTLDQANEAYKSFAADLKDTYKTAGYDARDAITSAQQTLKDAHNAKIQDVSGDIYDAVKKLKSEVQSQSGQALKTLDNSNAHVDLAPVYSQIDTTLDKLNKSGTDEALAVADKLQAYKTRLMSNNWAKIPAPDAKRLVQGLDQITEYSPMAGNFDKAKNAAFKGVRSALDQSIKATVPEYADAMKPVADTADLLGRVQDFGDKQTAAGLLSRINAPNQMENRAALQELGQRYKTDFIGATKPENLPESRFLNNALAAQESLRPDRVAAKIDQTLTSSRQRSALDAAQSGYDSAQQNLAPFKPLAPNIAGQTTAQQKLMQLGKGKNIELTDMFQKLGNLTNTDFVQAMKDQNTLAQFQKGATNGSRNTLMGAVAGWLFGGATGGAIGAGAGRAVDQWGPAITKKVLDGAIRVTENPTVATITKLDLPETVKRNMVIGLEQYLSGAGQGGEQTAVRSVADTDQKPNRSPAKGPDAWAQRGIQNLGIDSALAQTLLQDPKAKQLLIQASDLSPSSRAMKQIMNQIKKGWGQ